MSFVQTTLFVGMGLQFKTIDTLQKDLKLAANQLLPLFNKAVVKYTKLIKAAYESDVVQTMEAEEKQKPADLLKNEKLKGQLHEELKEGKGTELAQQMASEKDDFIKKLAVKSHSDFTGIDNKAAALKSGAIVSIPRKRQASEDEETLR